jgi:hypothetical protein
MPGYLFRPSTSQDQRRTLIMNNGSDPITSIWPPVSAGGVARGYNVLVFDGPGQQSMLFERNIPFRHDWEQVITPVVDFLLARPDVDPAGIVLYGISQAGYWVPRALAFEHRIAAAIADPRGVQRLRAVVEGSTPANAAAAGVRRQTRLRSILQRRDATGDAGRAAELGVARQTVRPAITLRCLHRRPEVQPQRCGGTDHDAIADHRP